MKRILIIVIISSFSFINCFAQSTWQRTIGGPGMQEGQTIAGTNDGGCICAGVTTSYGAGNTDIYVVKLNSEGSVQWTKTFGGPYLDNPGNIIQTIDGGYILTGFFSSPGYNILKLTPEGNIEWNENIAGAMYVIQTSDGGYACAGYISLEKEEFCLIKLNSSGTVQWNKIIGSDSLDYCMSVIQTSDRGYALVGFTKSFGAGLEDYYVVKLDSNGTFQWNCTVGGPTTETASSIIQTSDGSYVVVGISDSFGGWKRYIVKLNANGTLQWQRTALGAINMWVPVVETPDNGYVVLSTYNSNLSIIKLSSSGNSVWHKEIGGGSEEVSYSLSTATDGGFFLSGRSKSFNGGLSNMYVVKLDSGWTTCDYIYSTSNTVEAASGIWGNPSPNVFSISLTASASNCSVSSGGTAFSVCTYIPTVYSVSGTVRYQDNNQPVSSGCVKAVRFDSATNNIITVDSAQIQPNGTYTLLNCPPITLDIMAYENDEEDLYFVPTYYVSTIYWQNATHVKPDSSLVNIDIGVYRIVNPGANMHISGYIYKSSFFDDYDFIKDAFVYAKSGGFYKGYSISNAGGFYQIDSLSNGTYEIIVDRMGFYPATQFAIINGSSINNFNFNLLPIVKVEPNNTEVPEKFSLSQNYPNPFNPQTEIHFALPKESNVKLVIYDIIGREVAVLADGLYKAGIYSVNFEGTNIASGIYFYRIEAGDFTESRKMILLK